MPDEEEGQRDNNMNTEEGQLDTFQTLDIIYSTQEMT